MVRLTPPLAMWRLGGVESDIWLSSVWCLLTCTFLRTHSVCSKCDNKSRPSIFKSNALKRVLSLRKIIIMSKLPPVEKLPLVARKNGDVPRPKAG